MYLSVPKRSVPVGVSVFVFFCSNAQLALAPSICLRLAMQALFWLSERALIKFGIAMAASRAIMATTIMISTSVKPALRDEFVFIFLSHFGVNESERRVSLINNKTILRSLTAFHRPILPLQQRMCHRPRDHERHRNMFDSRRVAKIHSD